MAKKEGVLEDKINFKGFFIWHDGQALNFDLKRVRANDLRAVGNPSFVVIPYDTDYQPARVTNRAVLEALSEEDRRRVLNGEITRYSLGCGEMLGKFSRDGVKYPM